MISKRVAMLLSNPYKPDPRVQKEARSLIDSGYLVNLHCWDRQGKYPSDESRDGMEIHRISGRSGYGAGTRQTLHIPGFWRSAIQQVREYKPDIIHCHDLDTLPAGWFLKRNMDTKLVYDAHEDYPALMNLYLPGIFVYLLKILERRLLNHVDSVITPSTELADKFRSLGVEQVKTVGNYQSLENYDAISEIDIHATRSKFNLEREDLVITYIGNFSRNRLLLPLIEAAKHLPHVHVLLWGDGHQRQDIERAISYTRNVHYLGWSPHDQVPLQFSIADIVYYCLVPDFPGSMPNALSSALAG